MIGNTETFQRDENAIVTASSQILEGPRHSTAEVSDFLSSSALGSHTYQINVSLLRDYIQT